VTTKFAVVIAFAAGSNIPGGPTRLIAAAGPRRAPDVDVLNDAEYSTLVTPAPRDVTDKLSACTAAAATMVYPALTAETSDEVDTEIDLGPGALGLMIPEASTSTLSPAEIPSWPLMVRVAVDPVADTVASLAEPEWLAV
jgi:hypothetical protein